MLLIPEENDSFIIEYTYVSQIDSIDLVDTAANNDDVDEPDLYFIIIMHLVQNRLVLIIIIINT